MGYSGCLQWLVSYANLNCVCIATWYQYFLFVATKSIKEHVLEFQSNNIQFLWVQFRWIQYDTIGSPVWAIDEIIIECPKFQVYESISFEEEPK